MVFGYFLAAAAYDSRANSAETRATRAESLAEQFREDATKGRALAAVLQAEHDDIGDPGNGIIRRHRALATNLYGRLTVDDLRRR
jgi:hypothetical protein